MRLDDEEMSDNVEKRTGGGMRTVGIGGGIGGIIIIVLALLFKQDPQQVMQAVQQAQGPGQSTEKSEKLTTANASPFEVMSAKVLNSTDRVWKQEFQQRSKTYETPRMVLFQKGTESGCGFAESAMGPFYCPTDHRVYLDVSFFDELEQQFGVKGDFSKAYVIAHEVGHHVQNLLGISGRMQAMRSRLSEKEYNKLSVMLELQADFFAGVWAYRANQIKPFLDPGDIESGLNAASAVGDDRLQKAATGQVVPDAFTHGTSEQRMYWFKKGFQSGDVKQGDTGIGLGSW
ncbi:MAG: neutral zinc metallopeptidase [Chitinophaga sp.]|uniref:KPN_02809 family neutral zinc metallopeptidase n=1 Tax=Chitinophaga sp. TaxID=1869181 RepID=UPI001B26B36A|nr:neutral zinc metallopeptidase [Chitinophaga sp.]MBO9731142.1 neutral zinc metallopeptidase [Chitinophaga sp.]